MEIWLGINQSAQISQEIFFLKSLNLLIIKIVKKDFYKSNNLNCICNEKYFTKKNIPEQHAWDYNMIRFGDQCPAIACALGIESFEKVKRILNFKGVGKIPFPQMIAKEQVSKIFDNHSRKPKHVLDIGGGRGEVSLALSYLGIDVQMVESCKCAQELLQKTSKRLEIKNNVKLINCNLIEALEKINWKKIDTVIFTESIEHINKEESNIVFKRISKVLHKNKGYLIITNWIDSYPIIRNTNEHCSTIDNLFYQNILDHKKVICRNGSYLVVKF